MKNPYEGKKAGRNIIITIALIALSVFLWNAYISPLMAFGDAVNIKNTGSCTFTCFLTNVNNDASFTVSPGQTKTISLPNIGGIYKGACYDPMVYVHGVSSTYTEIDTARGFTYNFNIPQTNCVGTTTTTQTGTYQSCKPEDYDADRNCIIDTNEYNLVSDMDLDCSGSQCANFHQNCYLKILGAYSYHLNPNQGSPPTVRYTPCDFGSATDCSNAMGYDSNKDCFITTAEYNKASTDKNNQVITDNCYQKVLTGYQAWALNSQKYAGCSFTTTTTQGVTTTRVTTTNPPTTTLANTCESAGYYSNQLSGFSCTQIYVPILSKNCYSCNVPPTTMPPNCFTAWTYVQIIGDAQGTCVNQQFCNYAGSPVTYATKEACDSANTSPSNIWPIIVLGGLIAVALIFYLKKKK
jgi:hypothetical protein